MGIFCGISAANELLEKSDGSKYEHRMLAFVGLSRINSGVFELDLGVRMTWEDIKANLL
jgi:hypothetical protein